MLQEGQTTWRIWKAQLEEGFTKRIECESWKWKEMHKEWHESINRKEKKMRVYIQAAQLEDTGDSSKDLHFKALLVSNSMLKTQSMLTIHN